MQIILYVRSELANSDGIVPSFIEQQQPFFTHGMQKVTGRHNKLTHISIVRFG